jgi:hypothetical protein
MLDGHPGLVKHGNPSKGLEVLQSQKVCGKERDPPYPTIGTEIPEDFAGITYGLSAITLRTL